MPDVKIADPLGREITLHDRTWFGHIIKGHPEVEHHRQLVEQALKNPSEIRHSRSDSDCRLYYGTGPRQNVIIQAVADVSQGLVKTAHLAKRVSGGDVEWSKQTP